MFCENLPFLCHCEAARRPWQSLTERNGIPERSLEKQREAVCVLHARHHLVLLVSCPRIKQQAGANKSVCSCFLPPDGVSAQPPCSAAFQRSCVLHCAFSYDPSARSADRIPLGRKKCPSRTRRERAAARRAANEILRREFGASVFGLFAAYPMARIANAEKMCYNLS